MALGLFCLGLILMGVLQTQSSVLSKVPLEPDFRDEKFQGKWFTIGGAENKIQKEGKPAMHRITYKLEDDHSFCVTSTWLSEQDCEHWSNRIVPSEQPGQFTIANITSLSGIQNFTMTVVVTNYNQFAIVFYDMIVQDSVQRVASLFGRTMELSPELKKRFVKVTMTLGFTDENIFFPDPMEESSDPLLLAQAGPEAAKSNA
ncbi:neutrophil gelatinase-associated lipocalin-like [Erethizon dorsatum]